MSSEPNTETLDILIVDDDQVDREFVRRTLSRAERFKARLTETGGFDDGLRAAAEGSFDLILIDYIMPGRSGLELLRELRENGHIPDTAVIIMSHAEDDELALQCLRAGAQDFLLKSEISVSKLARIIMQARTRFELEHAVKDATTRADTDTLTGLANRARFERALRSAIDGTRRGDSRIALMLFDLDRFKGVNDSYGHHIGDGLLRAVTQRISDSLRDREFFARLGGDEFGILLTGLSETEHAAVVARRVIDLFETPFTVGDHRVSTSISIGISIAPDNATGPEELMKFADAAMYQAKASGRARYAFFGEAMRQEFLDRRDIERSLARALEKRELFVLYQPIYGPGGEQIRGAEALLRWAHGGEIHLPTYFMPIAESADLATRLGHTLIDQAVPACAAWRRQHTDLFLAINLSTHQLLDAAIIERLREISAEHQVPCEHIEVEICEDTLHHDPAVIERRLRELADAGFGITLDNFGSGHSSVEPIIDLPIGKIKICGSIMKALEAEGGAKILAFLRGFKAMADHIGIEIAVAGVESQHQRAICKSLGIRQMQGYLLGRPGSAEAFAERLMKNTPAA
ncbi:MAG: EAL domain-containing protein [Halieaceae bacterium]|jgi:diguanylate cyclase (GGDEF)-like protein|nr:EAL domain-containing protein [Halieaceae bacterium]